MQGVPAGSRTRRRSVTCSSPRRRCPEGHSCVAWARPWRCRCSTPWSPLHPPWPPRQPPRCGAWGSSTSRTAPTCPPGRRQAPERASSSRWRWLRSRGHRRAPEYHQQSRQQAGRRLGRRRRRSLARPCRLPECRAPEADRGRRHPGCHDDRPDRRTAPRRRARNSPRSSWRPKPATWWATAAAPATAASTSIPCRGGRRPLPSRWRTIRGRCSSNSSATAAAPPSGRASFVRTAAFSTRSPAS